MPPKSTPAAPPPAATALQTPSARARAVGSRKLVVRIVSVAGARTAPPSPWRARAVTSIT